MSYNIIVMTVVMGRLEIVRGFVRKVFVDGIHEQVQDSASFSMFDNV